MAGPLPALRPDVRAAPRVDKLRGHAQPFVLALNAPLQDVADIERPADLAHVGRLSLVGHRRVARDHVEVSEAGEVGDDVLGEPVSQPTGWLITREVVEGQYRDRGLAGGRQLTRPPERVPTTHEAGRKHHGRGRRHGRLPTPTGCGHGPRT